MVDCCMSCPRFRSQVKAPRHFLLSRFTMRSMCSSAKWMSSRPSAFVSASPLDANNNNNKQGQYSVQRPTLGQRLTKDTIATAIHWHNAVRQITNKERAPAHTTVCAASTHEAHLPSGRNAPNTILYPRLSSEGTPPSSSDRKSTRLNSSH